jgi:hypothetical protein
MGDSYASSGGASRHFGYSDPKWAKARNGSFEEPTAYDQGIEPKSLMMIPERFAIAMVDSGWLLRNSIIWYKPNGMPSSVKDRLSNKWEYVFFFTKSQKYYFDLNSIRKPLEESSIKRISQENIPNQFKSGKSVEFAKTDPVNNIPKIVNNMHQKYQQDGSYQGSHSGYFNDDGSLRVSLRGANPGDVVVPVEKPYAIAKRDKDYVEYRNLPPLEEVADFLNKHRKELGYTIDQIENKINSQAPHHWFNAESYPGVDDWKRIKDILMLPDTYDKAMTEVFWKSSEKQNDPNGANPGDVIVPDTVEFFRQKGQGGNFDYGGINSENGSHYNQYGTNPGDVISQPAVRHKSWASNPGHKFPHERKYDPDADGGDFFDIPTRAHSFAHFAVFPETLVEPFIKAGCPPNGIVLDPFAGSGTVGVVAMKQEKNAILIEISPEYCNIIKKRLNWGRGLGVEYEHVVGEITKRWI